MAKVYLDQKYRCAACGSVMQNDSDNTTRCTFPMCIKKQIRYDLPTVDLTRSRSKRTEQKLTMGRE